MNCFTFDNKKVYYEQSGEGTQLLICSIRYQMAVCTSLNAGIILL